jgi:hypothetical protein
MARRYSRILQAARYYSAIDNYIKYITDASKRGQKVGSGRDRVPSQILYIAPFGIKLGTGSIARVSGAKPTWDARKGIFAVRTRDTIPDTLNAIKIDGFKAARLVIATGRGTGVAETSKITGMKYLKYGGKSTSIPFGGVNATEKESEAFEELKTEVLSKIAGALVTLTPEKI